MSGSGSVTGNRATERAASRLHASLDKNLVSYAMAAGAAGVGLLALVQPADAKIVYTPAHKNIGAKTFIDLNHDGINDFKLTLVRTSGCVGRCTTTGMHHGTAFQATYANLNVFGVSKANQIYGQGKLASALPAGVQVGPKSKFPGGNVMATEHAISGNNAGYYGAWAGTGAGVQHRFLGLKFKIHGETHFGWARLNVTLSQGAHIQATLTGYAYETVANQPIITGKTKGPEADDGNATSARVSMPTPVPPSLGLACPGLFGLGGLAQARGRGVTLPDEGAVEIESRWTARRPRTAWRVSRGRRRDNQLKAPPSRTKREKSRVPPFLSSERMGRPANGN